MHAASSRLIGSASPSTPMARPLQNVGAHCGPASSSPSTRRTSCRAVAFSNKPCCFIGRSNHSNDGGKFPSLQGSRIVDFPRERGRVACRASTGMEILVGLGLFFSPSIALAIYSLIIGEGDIGQGFSVALTQISRGYFQPNLGGEKVPVCDGKLEDLVSTDEPLFCFLHKWFLKLGGVWKLEFGPKAFLVVSDPVVVRYLLKENVFNYNKGVLAEILEPIMGTGLIPADVETWKPRRRAIAPAFHQAYLESMVQMFGRCTQRTVDKYKEMVEGQGDAPVVNMEKEFLSLGLDIIGLGVFNYDFGCISEESPVIQAVYGLLKEAEHRSTFYFPYWDIPGASLVVPRQREFRRDLGIVNDCLDELISLAKQTKAETDLEHLQNRDYSKVSDPSLLRFLVDLRGEDASDKQLRDDLMTLLIAGHETTAAVLTWCLFLLVQDEEWMGKVLQEIDDYVGDGHPDIAGIRSCKSLRLALAESLRLYPQPPILIRRAIKPDVLPGGMHGPEEGFPVGEGADIFISTWNLHRSPHCWEAPDEFRPQRFLEEFKNEGFGGKWAGFNPSVAGNSLYPNEAAADFAFVPFGGGARKCVGDQFALMEATVAMIMLLRKFKFSLQGKPEDMKMATGATIHTANGLLMTVEKRVTPSKAAAQKVPVSAMTT